MNIKFQGFVGVVWSSFSFIYAEMIFCGIDGSSEVFSQMEERHERPWICPGNISVTEDKYGVRLTMCHYIGNKRIWGRKRNSIDTQFKDE